MFAQRVALLRGSLFGFVCNVGVGLCCKCEVKALQCVLQGKKVDATPKIGENKDFGQDTSKQSCFPFENKLNYNLIEINIFFLIRLVQQLHPDKNLDNNNTNTTSRSNDQTSFEDIERAYRVLSDTRLRTELDAQLQSSRKQDVIINEQLLLTDFQLDVGKMCLSQMNAGKIENEDKVE